MNGKNRPLVTDELVKFEKEPVEVQDFCKITDHLRGIYGVHLKLIKKNRKITTCNWLDLETLGSQSIMQKNLPGHLVKVQNYGDLVVCT